MRNLTEIQKNFLLDNFFVNEYYLGWKSIAESLLESGECIVAGTECIWRGGIGNFIKTSVAPNLIGCQNYKLDLKGLLSSKWYKDFHAYTLQVLKEKEALMKRSWEELNFLR